MSRSLPVPTPEYAHGDGAPSLELRLLALYRLWGTIQYFFPYRDLADRPWDGALAEFIPVFIAADTRAKYETAVLQLTARMSDSHARVGGLTATAKPNLPGIFPRYVEGSLVVAGVYDDALRDRITVGDGIIAVDGVAVTALEARWTPLIASSTPQALHRSLALNIIAGPADSVAVLTLRGRDGREYTVRAPRLPPQRIGRDGPVWRMLDGNVGYIDLDRLTQADANHALDELID